MSLENNYIFILIINIIFSLIFFYNIKKIANFLNVFDYPDKKRKFHKGKTPLIGSFIYLFGLALSLVVFKQDFVFFQSNKVVFSITLTSLMFFFIGYLDDKYNLKPNIKLFLFSILILFIISVSDIFLIKELRLLIFDKNISLLNLSFFFTIFCILLFVNAFNMFDGVNLQSGIYIVIISIYFIFKGIFPLLSFTILILSLIFLFFNYFNKCFLGNSGSYFLSFIISLLFIFSYNDGRITSCEEIFVLMMIPGLDLLRVSIIRALSGKHPFSPDRNHLHHILMKRFGFNALILLIILIIGLPILILILSESIMTSLIFGVVMYVSIIYISKKIKLF